MSKDATIPLPMDRKLFLSAQVNQKSILDISKSILDINEDDERLRSLYGLYGINNWTPPPIDIYIDSYGGAVYQCFGLIGIMETSRTKIHTIVTGCAMSCGFMILISGHRRFTYEHSTPLFHQISSGIIGTASEIEAELFEVKRLQAKMEKLVIQKTKITRSKLDDIYNKKTDWFMSPTEALKLGVVDEIIKKSL